MPGTTVQIDLSSATGTTAQETYSDTIIFGRAPTENEPAFGFNTVETFRDPTLVADATTDGSGVHVSSQTLASAGVREWQVIVAESTSTSEEVASGATVSNTPVDGQVEVTVGGTVAEPTTETPPTTPEAGEPPVFNYDTGEVAYSDAGPLSVEYSYLSWTDAFRAVNGRDTDLAYLADRRIGVGDVGDLDRLQEWGAGNYTFVVGALENGNAYDSATAYRQAAQEVSTYLQSTDLALWAHRSSDDVAAAVAGWLATHRPWQDPTFGDLNISGDPIDSSQVGDPETQDSFEGGDSEGNGPINAIYTPGQTGTLVSSNDLTTAGSGSNYRYLDVRRTEGMVAQETEDALVGLAMRESDQGIPFNDTGQDMIENVLIDRLGQYEYDRGAYTDLDIVVPDAETVGQQRRSNRIWGVIDIGYRINGNVHRFRVRIRAEA